MQSRLNVLLVEDDRSIATALAHALKNVYSVAVAHTGQMAIYQANSQNYDAIVLDLHLPDLSGMAICKQLRDKGHKTPILVLTGDSHVMTKISLLDGGANDYLTKPFSLGELKARLRVLTRPNRQLTSQLSDQLSADGLVIDRLRRTVNRDGIEIYLRPKEFALLECLIEHNGLVVSRNLLNRHAWQGESKPWTNTLEVHIKHLRDKIDRPFAYPLIHTVHGIGYKLATVLPKPNSKRVSI